MNFWATGVKLFFAGTLIFAFPSLATFLPHSSCQLFLWLQNIQLFPLLVKPFLPRPARAPIALSTKRSLPVTSQDFRRLALSFPGTAENSHMDHPDFWVAGKIFATLGYPEDGWAMVKLTPLEQELFMKSHPTVFGPCTGAWGRRGATSVLLKSARMPTLRRALEAAWRLAAPKTLTRQFDLNR
jgi:hypothetical protein